ncbi:CYTH domain-containing protein [Kitasatospora sp. NPDC004669]|uniref:CYTH domain-containing protein n=1 Tax=Kitasatospora sp. NPDC004669 TaxID=3154555 RepID=UPI0033A04A28
MIEAELKALVRQPSLMLRTLEGAHGPGRAEVYRDTYYDLPDGSLLAADRELRIRDIESVDGTRRTLLTYKAPREAVPGVAGPGAAAGGGVPGGGDGGWERGRAGRGAGRGARGAG